MLIAARIHLIDKAAELLAEEARTMRLNHTPAPHNVWPDAEEHARDIHDEMILTAHGLTLLSREMRQEAAV